MIEIIKLDSHLDIVFNISKSDKKHIDAITLYNANIPDKTFRDAFILIESEKIKDEETGEEFENIDKYQISIDLNKAKDITHNIRRTRRYSLFKYLDVEATIPSIADQAESERQKIRELYADIQIKIDAANTVDELKSIISQMA